MSFSYIGLSRECKVPLFIRTPISSGEAEGPSEGTGMVVDCWAGLGHSSWYESELLSLTSDSTSEQCLLPLSPETTEGWHESDREDSPASALSCTVKYMHMHPQLVTLIWLLKNCLTSFSSIFGLLQPAVYGSLVTSSSSLNRTKIYSYVPTSTRVAVNHQQK